jgi:hypothetical protein
VLSIQLLECVHVLRPAAFACVGQADCLSA